MKAKKDENSGKHLPEQEILDYTAGTLEKKESDRIGRHLARCGLCRAKMPPPTKEQFIQAMLGGGTNEEEE